MVGRAWLGSFQRRSQMRPTKLFGPIEWPVGSNRIGDTAAGSSFCGSQRGFLILRDDAGGGSDSRL